MKQLKFFKTEIKNIPGTKFADGQGEELLALLWILTNNKLRGAK